MKITKQKLKEFAVISILGFAVWTVCLTPWMLFVTQMTTDQYIMWVFAGIILNPPISVIAVKITNKAVKKLCK